MLITLAVILAQLTAPTLKPDLQAFLGSSWPAVDDAKERLESRQAEVIPSLIDLCARTDRNRLTDTADLIYPGAQTFWGHGLIVDYDLDAIAARAVCPRSLVQSI